MLLTLKRIVQQMKIIMRVLINMIKIFNQEDILTIRIIKTMIFIERVEILKCLFNKNL